jgi:sigma-E factor negative regulatory protein RseA
MSQTDSYGSSSRRILSALADGDATDGEAARAFQAWRDDEDARATWHSYQLIGDVLRSDDLAQEPAADERFLVALRARGRWQGPLAMAAGFLAVMTGLNIVRPFNHAGADAGALAAAAAASSTALAQAGNGAAATQAKADADQLAPYLAAHRQSTMSGPFQMPGGDIRSVSLVQTAP